MDFPDFVIRRLEAGPDTGIFREIRLEALKTAPEAFLSDYASEKAKPPEGFGEMLTNADMFGAFHGEELIGIAGLHVVPKVRVAHKGELWAVYVRPKARSAGVARKLIEAVLEHARGRVEQVNLSVERGNMNARRLYTSLGFVEYGLEKNAVKIGERYFDDVLMAKALVP